MNVNVLLMEVNVQNKTAKKLVKKIIKIRFNVNAVFTIVIAVLMSIKKIINVLLKIDEL